MVRQEPRKRVQKRRAKRHISTTKAETTTQPETSAQSLIRKAVKVTVVVGNQQKKTKEDPTPLSSPDRASGSTTSQRVKSDGDKICVKLHKSE